MHSQGDLPGPRDPNGGRHVHRGALAVPETNRKPAIIMQSKQHLVPASFERTRRDETAPIFEYVEYGQN